MPELISEKVVKARKDHGCMLCSNVAVHTGEEYTRQVLKYDDHLYVWLTCVPCETVLRKAHDEDYGWDHGVGEDEAQEWAWGAYETDADARAYLLRCGYTEERLAQEEADNLLNAAALATDADGGLGDE